MDEKQASSEGAQRRVGESFPLGLKFNMAANLILAGIFQPRNTNSMFLSEESAF